MLILSTTLSRICIQMRSFTSFSIQVKNKRKPKYHHYPLFTFSCKVWTEDKLVASFKKPPFNIDFHHIQINHMILYVGNFNLHMSLTKCVTSKARSFRRFLKRKSLIQCSYKDRCFFHQQEEHIQFQKFLQQFR